MKKNVFCTTVWLPVIALGLMLGACEEGQNPQKDIASKKAHRAKGTRLGKGNALSDRGIKGKVKEIRTAKYEYSNGEKKLQHIYYSRYNEMGYMVSGKTEDPAGVTEDTSKYWYDEYMNDTLMLAVDPGGKVIEKYREQYDQSGNEIKRLIYGRAGILRDSTLYAYNDKDSMVHVWNVQLKESDTVNNVYQYRYDEQGCMMQSVYKSYGTIRSKFYDSSICHCDDKQMISRVDHFDRDNKYTGFETYSYYADGKIKEVCKYNTDSSLVERYTDTYDELGNKKETKSFDARGKVTFCRQKERKYDATGNVTEETTYELSNGKKPEPIYTTEYLISYY